MTHTTEQLNDLRIRVLAGQDVSVEEYAALIQSLRQRRNGDVEKAATAKATKPRASKSAGPSIELPDLLKDL